MRERLQESEDLSSAAALSVIRRALRYAEPFRRDFAVKILLIVVSLLPLMVLPWPLKILIDNVILGESLDDPKLRFPFFMQPVLELLQGASKLEVLLAMLAIQFVLLVLIGAFGTTGRERDTTSAYLAGGWDTATSTENAANAGFSLTGGILGLIDFRFTLRLTQKINHYYRARLFERIQALPLTSFDDERIGDAVYRVMYDTPSITEVVYRVLLTPVGAPTAIGMAVLILGSVYGWSSPIVWFGLSFVLVAFVPTLPFAGMLRRRGGGSRRAGSTTTSTVEEGMANIVAVQSLGGEGRERGRFDEQSTASFKHYRLLMLAGFFATLSAGVVGLFVVVQVILYAVEEVIAGRLTPGDFGVLLGYFATIAASSVDLGAVWVRIQENSAGLHRVFFLMDLPAEADPPDARPAPRIERDVCVDSVHYSYERGSDALHDVTFRAETGRITAFAGPAGAGKTTLAYLIPRFITPQQGTVRVDGVDVAGVTMDSLRAQIAFVFQETTLFDATIEENIRMGKPDASESEVRRAARTAGADEFVRNLPQGYQTRLGRAGGKLSVGQKQRLSIARALVRGAKILILDEPTSALDPDTERQLVASLREASRECIVIVIAHRLSTIREADQILFVEAGEILERGTHAALMTRPDGAYRNFVELQTRGVA